MKVSFVDVASATLGIDRVCRWNAMQSSSFLRHARDARNNIWPAWSTLCFSARRRGSACPPLSSQVRVLTSTRRLNALERELTAMKAAAATSPQDAAATGPARRSAEPSHPLVATQESTSPRPVPSLTLTAESFSAQRIAGVQVGAAAIADILNWYCLLCYHCDLHDWDRSAQLLQRLSSRIPHPSPPCSIRRGVRLECSSLLGHDCDRVQAHESLR